MKEEKGINTHKQGEKVVKSKKTAKKDIKKDINKQYMVKLKTTDLIPDDKNFNKGSESGKKLINKSIAKFGAGRSILIDKNNRIIAGNKTIENAIEMGINDVEIIESDGKRIIAVKRTDIDLDTPQGREMALADNASAKENIVFDAELVEAELGEVVAEEWVFKTGNTQTNNQALPDNEIYLNVHCVSEKEANKLYQELSKKGYECKVII